MIIVQSQLAVRRIAPRVNPTRRRDGTRMPVAAAHLMHIRQPHVQSIGRRTETQRRTAATRQCFGSAWKALTQKGTKRSLVSPRPSWPCTVHRTNNTTRQDAQRLVTAGTREARTSLFVPQEYKSPSPVNARVNPDAAATALTRFLDSAFTGCTTTAQVFGNIHGPRSTKGYLRGGLVPISSEHAQPQLPPTSTHVHTARCQQEHRVKGTRCNRSDLPLQRVHNFRRCLTGHIPMAQLASLAIPP
jgi:hypothetical protein